MVSGHLRVTSPHHVVFSLDEVYRLVHTDTKELGNCALATSFHFPVLPSESDYRSYSPLEHFSA